MSAKFRSPLARVRGLGAAHGGVEHWWHQRVTAIALIPLVLIFMGYVLALVGGNYAMAANVMGRPLPALVGLLLVVALFWHLRLGATVIIEDYVHSPARRIAATLFVTFATTALGLLCALALLSLVIGA